LISPTVPERADAPQLGIQKRKAIPEPEPYTHVTSFVRRPQGTTSVWLWVLTPTGANKAGKIAPPPINPD